MKNKIKALIIDDEIEGRYVLETMLARIQEIELLASLGDAESGLDAIEKLNPELVFLDIRMPYMSGLDMVKELHERKLTTTIVFVTAYDKFGIQAIKLAAYDYLLKPIDPEELRSVIHRFIKSKKSE
jgi:two-component system LytT family response regulator